MIKRLAGHYVQEHEGDHFGCNQPVQPALPDHCLWTVTVDPWHRMCRFDMEATCAILLIITLAGVTERCQRLDELNKTPILQSIQTDEIN